MKENHTAVLSGESLHMLAYLHPLEHHDDRGPGYVFCAVCDASQSMKWEGGVRKDDPSKLKHDPKCPVHIARRVLFHGEKHDIPYQPDVDAWMKECKAMHKKLITREA